MAKAEQPRPLSYCHYVKALPLDDVNRIYHDKAYCVAVETDAELFERLILEINQAGLSWSTILKKQAHFKKAYSQFNIKKIAQYTDQDIQRLLNDAGIIRNRLKVHAAIHNAQVVLQLQQQHGSFKAWIDQHHPLEKPEWVKLFKKTFKFTGGEIVGEFLMSLGYLPGAHHPDCALYPLYSPKTLRKASAISPKET